MISPYKLIDNCLAKSIGIMVRWFGFANGSRAHRLQQTLIAKKAKCAYQGYPGPRMVGYAVISARMGNVLPLQFRALFKNSLRDEPIEVRPMN